MPATESIQDGARATCWAITTGEAGMTNQARGLARLLDPGFAAKTVKWPRSLRAVPPNWLLPSRPILPGTRRLAELLLKGAGLAPPWPKVVVTCGRRSVGYALAIRLLSGGRSATIHIQHPRVPLDRFDLVLLPEHDLSGGTVPGNVILTTGATHHLTESQLREAGGIVREEWSGLPRPWFGLLLGGKSRSYDMTVSDVNGLVRSLERCRAEAGGGSLLITASRRTPAEAVKALRKQIAGTPNFFWEGDGLNPYLPLLAQADYLGVTCDSVSMLSEACFSGKPVYMLSLTGHSARFEKFHSQLVAGNYARWIHDFDPDWTAKRLVGLTALMPEIRQRIGME